MGSVCDAIPGGEDGRSLENFVGACDGGDQRNPSIIVAPVSSQSSSGDNNTEIPYCKFERTYSMEANDNIMSEPHDFESHGEMRKNTEEDGVYFPKWRLPSKIRRKFRVSEEDSTSRGADHLNENNNVSVDTHSPRNTLRACVDCSTTRTPLWRSGPQGPKSLCNACGIRYRKKRRALFASLGHEVAQSVKPKKRSNPWDAASAIKKQPRSNKARVDELDQMRLKLKFLAFCKGMEKDLYGSFSKGPSPSSSSSSSAIQRRFAQEEEEAARLLMAISYGLVLA